MRNQTNGPELVAIMLVTAPISNASNKVLSSIYLYLVTGILAMLAAFLLAAWLAKDINLSMRVLSKRVSDMVSQKPTPTSGGNLSGDWLVLSQKIDEAFSSMRASIQNLRNQLSQVGQETEHTQKQGQSSNAQFDALNRQISAQARQMSELSKQISHANQQSVALQHRLNAVLQSSTEGFFILDQFGNILSANPVILNWLGTNEKDIAGKYCFDLVKKPGEQADNINEENFAKHTGDPHDLISRFFPQGVVHNIKDKKSTEVLAHLQPIADSAAKIEGYILVLRNRSLHSEGVRSTPSPVVIGETFLITRLIADCMGELAPKARENQLSLDYKSVTGLPNMVGDREAIGGVLIQVLEKMIADTAAGGRVRVESTVKDSEVHVSVSSSGPALPESEIADMFVGFIADKHSQDTYGARLSMYLARNNIERMGGKIWAESESGRGTLIRLTLPLKGI